MESADGSRAVNAQQKQQLEASMTMKKSIEFMTETMNQKQFPER